MSLMRRVVKGVYPRGLFMEWITKVYTKTVILGLLSCFREYETKVCRSNDFKNAKCNTVITDLCHW